MSYYQPSDEPATERLLLIDLDSPEATYSTGEFRHLSAYVVRRAYRTHEDPDRPGHMIYGDGEDAQGYRRATWTGPRANALWIDGMNVACQMTVRESDGSVAAKRAYGADYKFCALHSIDRREAKHIANTFVKLDAGMKKLEEKFGYVSSDDYAQTCIRVANVLGIKTFVTTRKGRSGGKLSEASSFVEFNASSVASHVSDMIDRCYPAPAPIVTE